MYLVLTGALAIRFHTSWGSKILDSEDPWTSVHATSFLKCVPRTKSDTVSLLYCHFISHGVCWLNRFYFFIPSFHKYSISCCWGLSMVISFISKIFTKAFICYPDVVEMEGIKQKMPLTLPWAVSLSRLALCAVTNNWAPDQKGAMLISSWPQTALHSETSRCQQRDSWLSIVFRDWKHENCIELSREWQHKGEIPSLPLNDNLWIKIH